MYRSKIGVFNGDSWEELCQSIFKAKYRDQGYQEIRASPGDFGIEGYVTDTNTAYQCYCPNFHYNQTELYNKQREKITEDLEKLREYESEIGSRLGGTLIKSWCFVTPEVNRNKLLRHAKEKQKQVRSWNLKILSPDFRVLIHDADFYLKEINEHRALAGEAIQLNSLPLEVPELEKKSEYEENILRKTKLRIAAGQANNLNLTDEQHQKKIDKLYDRTLNDFLNFNVFCTQLDASSSVVYHKVERILATFQKQVDDWSDTLSATPNELTEKIRTDLTNRLLEELRPHVDYALATDIVNHAVANWLGLCQLDYE